MRRYGACKEKRGQKPTGEPSGTTDRQHYSRTSVPKVPRTPEKVNIC